MHFVTPTLAIATESVLPVSLAAAGVALVFVLACEYVHARRGARLARLAFGPEERSRAWARAVPFYRAATVAGMAWALVYLLLMNSAQAGIQVGLENDPDAGTQEVVLLLDYSPSMFLEDSGKEGLTTRRDRMSQVISSILDRTGPHVRFTLICFYTKPLPIVRSASDKAIVRNVLNDLPIERAMSPGQTNLGSAVAKALEITRDLTDRPTMLILATDGDTDNPPVIGDSPDGLEDALVLGIGNTKVGMPIDGRLSRQDEDLLEEVAGALDGRYLDVTADHVPASAISQLLSSPVSPIKSEWTLLRIALVLFIVLALLYALLPLAQEYFGSNWRPRKRFSPEVSS